MELQDVIQRLYGLVPEEFTKARNDCARQARSAGDRHLAEEIRGLRKPSTAAWLVNLLVRRRAGEVSEMLQVGAQMRQAHRCLAAEELRTLDRQRKQLISALTDQARALGGELGHHVSDQVASQVRRTLHAAMADAGAASAVSAGMLTDAVEATGFGPVDLTGAVAMPVTGADPAEAPDGASGQAEEEVEQARTEARAQLTRAEAAASELAAAAGHARRRAEEAGRRRANLQAGRDRLQQQLRALEEDIAEATEAAKRAERGQEQAEEEREVAERAVAQARSRLAELG